MGHVKPHGIPPTVQPPVRLDAPIRHPDDLFQHGERAQEVSLFVEKLRVVRAEVLYRVISLPAGDIGRSGPYTEKLRFAPVVHPAVSFLTPP